MKKKEVVVPPRNSRRRESGGEWEPAFFAFWRLYPKKRCRDDAAKAFRNRVRAGVDPASIMAGLARHQFNADPQYVPYPAKWLRQGQWLDEPDARKADPFAWVGEMFAPANSADTFDGTTIDGEACDDRRAVHAR